MTITNAKALSATSVTVTLPSGFVYKGGTMPGSGGDCPTNGGTLLGNRTCKLAILFAPTSATTYNTDLSLSFFDGTQTRTITKPLTGTGVVAPLLHLSTTPTTYETNDTIGFGSTYIGATSGTVTFKLTYGGSSNPATSIAIAPSSANFSIISNTCPTSLVANESCTLGVRFNPTIAGSINNTLSVSYVSEGVARTFARNLNGTGLTPGSLSFSPSPLSFASQSTGAVYDQLLTVTRSGSYSVGNVTPTLTGTGFSYKGGTYPGTGGTCPLLSTLPTTCTIALSFSPTQAIAYTGQLSLAYYNGFQNTQTAVNLSGTGLATAKLVFSSGTYEWGKLIQTTTGEKTLTLTNAGLVAATNLSASGIGAPFAFKGGSYPGTSGTCGTSLEVNQSCTLVLVFSPTSVGVKTQTLSIDYHNGQGVAQSTATVTGEGIAQAIISISETNPYNFGSTSIGVAVYKIFTLTNAGSVAGTNLTGMFTSGFAFQGGSFPGTSGNCSTSLAAGASCTISLSFSPLSTGSQTGSFTLNYNDGLRLQTEIKDLQGTGL